MLIITTALYLSYQGYQRSHHISSDQLFTVKALSDQTQVSVQRPGIEHTNKKASQVRTSHLRAPSAASRTSQTGSSSKLVNLAMRSARTSFLSDVASETNWATEWQAHCRSVSLSLYNYQTRPQTRCSLETVESSLASHINVVYLFRHWNLQILTVDYCF